MTTMMSIVGLGFLLGMRHATDADHVVAVATIVSRERMVKFAAWLGALWGVGHTLTIVFVGLPIILFNWAVGPRIGLALEFSVGLMLMFLGVANLVGSRERWGYAHPHTHRHDPEVHPHSADDTPLGRLDWLFGGLGIYQAVRPLVVGVVHGLAGSAAVALLVLTTIRNPWWAIAYLVVFGAGTVAGMVLITTMMALPLAGVSGTSVRARRRLRLATGLVSFAFGVFLAYQIGVVDGLFSAAPQWTPQ
jgi:high-affinity nickel-transport protein